MQGTDSNLTQKGHCERGDERICSGRSMAEVTEGELRRRKDQVREFVYGERTLLFWRGRPEHSDRDRFLEMSSFARRTKADQGGKRMQ